MDVYKIFKTYTEVEELNSDLRLLESNGFICVTENIESTNEYIAINGDHGIVKIRESQIKKANNLLKLYKEVSPSNKEIFFFDNTEIMRINLHSKDYDKERVQYAKQIKKIRGIVMSFKEMQSINSLAKSLPSNTKKITPKESEKNGSSWFLWIGILSILNIIAFLLKQNISFLIALNYSYFFVGMMEGIKEVSGLNLIPLGYVLGILFPLFFFWIWYKSKNNNMTMYLVGIILYSIDALIPLLTKFWYDFGFHIFVLWMLFAGYSRLKNINKNKPDN